MAHDDAAAASGLRGLLQPVAAAPGLELLALDLRHAATWADERWLDDTERARLRRLAFERDRVRFAASRSALRALLSQRLQCHPRELSFGENERGKPFVIPPGARGAQQHLPFNLSHCEDAWVIAVGRAQPANPPALGVDAEWQRDVPDALELARIGLDERARRDLGGLDPADRSIAFLRAWTRREAALKAFGIGIALSQDEQSRFTIDALPDTVDAASAPMPDLVPDLVPAPCAQIVGWARAGLRDGALVREAAVASLQMRLGERALVLALARAHPGA